MDEGKVVANDRSWTDDAGVHHAAPGLIRLGESPCFRGLRPCEMDAPNLFCLKGERRIIFAYRGHENFIVRLTFRLDLLSTVDVINITIIAFVITRLRSLVLARTADIIDSIKITAIVITRSREFRGFSNVSA